MNTEVNQKFINEVILIGDTIELFNATIKNLKENLDAKTKEHEICIKEHEIKVREISMECAEALIERSQLKEKNKEQEETIKRLVQVTNENDQEIMDWINKNYALKTKLRKLKKKK